MLNSENSYLFKFAWKSIRRNSGRSFFIGFSVSLAVFIAVWVVAFFDGMNHQIEKAVVNTNIGYFQIQEANYAKSTDSSKPIEFDSIPKDIFSDPIKSYSPELILDSNISTPEGAAGLVAIGIQPSLHNQFLKLNKEMINGSFINDEDEGSVVIGEELARIFKFNVGDQMVLNFQDFQGELKSELLTIKGIYRFNGRSFEKKYVYLNQKTWQTIFFGAPKDKILFNRIPLMANSLEVESQITNKLKGTDLSLKTWKNINPEMAVVIDFHHGMIRFFFIIIGITITMTILNPVQMLWQERVKELRMLNTIGISSSKFWKIGLFEIFQMILLSGFFSCLLLFVIIGYQGHTGLDFSWLNEGVSLERAGIKLPRIVYPQLSAYQIGVTFIFVFFVLSGSYIWSIRQTLKKVEAPR